jgi:hypothetical protein
MGRYYTGDIEGKFWFGLQSSAAADRFGVEGTPPNYLEYYFDENDLENVDEEIALITETIGEDNLAKLEEFFHTHHGYNAEMLKEHNLEDIWHTHAEDYADIVLGIKIRDCIVETGSCSFEAEL